MRRDSSCSVLAVAPAVALHRRGECPQLAHQRLLLLDPALPLTLVDLPRLLARARRGCVGAVRRRARELHALALLGAVRFDGLALGGGDARDRGEGWVVGGRGGAIG